MKNELIELDERLSGVYTELHSIKTDMEKLYESEENNHKTVRLGLVLQDITNIQQSIEDETKGEETIYILVGGADDGKEFTHSDDLIKYLRADGDETYNDVSDDSIFDEAYQLGWFNIIKR